MLVPLASIWIMRSSFWVVCVSLAALEGSRMDLKNDQPDAFVGELLSGELP